MKGFVQTSMVVVLTAALGLVGFLDYKRYQYDIAWNVEFGDDGPLSSCYFKIVDSPPQQLKVIETSAYCVSVWMATYQEFQNE